MKRVVIAEDSFFIRRHLVAWLSDSFKVVATDNAHQALSLIDQHQPDWLLLNPVLAKNSGLELLYEISSWLDLRPVKTILLTQDTAYYKRYKKVLKELNVRHIVSLTTLDKNSLTPLLWA